MTDPLRAVASTCWLAAVAVTVLACMWFLPELLRPWIAFLQRVAGKMERLKKHAESELKKLDQKKANKNESDDHKRK